MSEAAAVLEAVEAGPEKKRGARQPERLTAKRDAAHSDHRARGQHRDRRTALRW